MLNEFKIPTNPRRMSNTSLDEDKPAGPWSIWNTSNGGSPSNVSTANHPTRLLDESPFTIESQESGGSLWRRNSAVTDPTAAAPAMPIGHYHQQQQQQNVQPNNHFSSVFRSSSFSGGGVQPLTSSLRKNNYPSSNPQTSPRFFQPQPNILERFSQVADATREAEMLGSNLSQLNLDNMNSNTNINNIPVQPIPPSRSEVASPSSNNNMSPYMSPTPLYAQPNLDGSHSSRSNSLSSPWRPQPFEPVAAGPGAPAGPIPIPSFQPTAPPPTTDYADFINNPTEFTQPPQPRPQYQASTTAAAAAAAHAAFMNPSSNTTSPTRGSAMNSPPPPPPPPPQQQGFRQNKYPNRNGNNVVQSPPQRKTPTDKDLAAIRSPLLEEFRSNKNKKYELRDLYGHIVEFSGDQHGSRFIQQRLESATSEEKEVIFNEIKPNSLQLMTDVFGNYVIQKFFELGNQPQKTILAKQMENHILNLSLQMYGCRVVQKAVEHVLTDQQATLIKELNGHVLKCVKDQNGNHVIQKAIERIPSEHITFILRSFKNQVYQLATHPYGCRVIQRMLEHSDEEAQQELLNELHMHTFSLVEDQYGNYVVQHVVQRGKPEDRDKIIDIVKDSLLTFSRHKYASNVVEKCIAHGTPKQRQELLDEILKQKPDGSLPITVMMRDQFANYVIQKMLDVTEGEQRERLVSTIKPQLQALKKFSYGKHLVSIERLMQLSEGHGRNSNDNN